MTNDHSRGPADTGWEVPSDRTGSRFWRMVVASLLAHVLLTPIPALLGLVAMLPALELGDDEEIVEVDLTALPVGPVAPTPEDQAPPPAEQSAPAAPELPPEDKGELPEAPLEPSPPKAEAPLIPDAPPGETKQFGDPVALAGAAGQIADSNANVRLFLFNDVVRDHPLGERVGRLLRRTPQWRDFFGPSRIDPVMDIDRVLIAGPQLVNSSQVVAVVQHGLGRERIETAFESLVARKGEWIDRPALLARARADRADRIFAAPNNKVVVVAPLKLEAQVRGLGENARFPEGNKDVAVTAYVIDPANAAKNSGIELPKSIKWARFDVRPLPDGGAVLKVLAEDESAETAQTHALFFQTLIEQLTTRAIFGFKKSFIKSVRFHNKGAEIHGSLEVTQAQLMFAADILEGYLPPERPEPPLAPGTTSPGSPSAPDGGGPSAPVGGTVPTDGTAPPTAPQAPETPTPGSLEPAP